MATAEGVKRLIVALSAAYRAEFDKAQIVTWARALEDIDDGDLDAAGKAWIELSSHMARPAEIREVVRSIVYRRKMNTTALPVEGQKSLKELFPVAQQGLAASRKALKDATGRGGVIKHVDDALAEEGGA